MDNVTYIICETQADIYEYIAKLGYDMEIFSNLYLKSEWCNKSMDTLYSRFQFADKLECLDFILDEIGYKLKKLDNKYFDCDVAYWIGFTYRQIYSETGIKSNELADIIPFAKMCGLYAGLHTIDEENAIDIICDNFNLTKLEKDAYEIVV